MSATTALIAATLLALPVLAIRDSLQDKRQRAAYFDDALSLFDSYRVVQDGKAWPILTGRYRGVAVRLEPVPDDMTWRKVPSLWLKATLLSPNPSRGTLGILARPRGGEFYSPTPEMAHRLAVPAAWPSDLLFCTDDMETLPEIDQLTPEMAVFDDPRMKDLVITPKGVRLVYQSAQAERAHYLVLRQARFLNNKADAALVRALLDRAISVAASVDDGCRTSEQPIAA
jgi:hypothetical protein